jgi:hypothetical protein
MGLAVPVSYVQVEPGGGEPVVEVDLGSEHARVRVVGGDLPLAG